MLNKTLLTAFMLVVAMLNTASAAEIRVFAAASTAGAIEEIARVFETTNKTTRIVAVHASSSTLAKQIVNGAPAHIYISANRHWMNFAWDRGGVERSTVTDLLTNRLVLVAPADTDWTIGIARGFDLLARLNGGYLAMGDPAHVPSGIYGREALVTLGVWKFLSDRVARAADARAALVLVERGEVAAGIVYATDARISEHVRVVATFPERTHAPIVYAAAIAKDAETDDTRVFFDFLRSKRAQKVWSDHGFALVPVAKPR
ncbi:MAG: molybdate ABC transporter substrate-binding protein [Rhodospirillales bacterium]|nr:molybdate ABC transporter substrate-binding protein [Rhodospirillales bacterium]